MNSSKTDFLADTAIQEKDIRIQKILLEVLKIEKEEENSAYQKSHSEIVELLSTEMIRNVELALK